MAASGYTRQANQNIQPNLEIKAEDINVELDAIAAAFDDTSGHDHSGAAVGDGAKISLTTAVVGILPIANGGSGSTTATGTGLNVLQTSPTIITPSLTGPVTVSTGGITLTVGNIALSSGTLTSSGAITATSGGIFDGSARVYSPNNQFNIASNNLPNPTGTANLAGVMCGLNQIFTPVKSTRIFVSFTGTVSNTTNATKIQMADGLGGAPANGASPIGTAIGNPVTSGSLAGDAFALNMVIAGLTLNTPIWIDLIQTPLVGGTSSLTNITFSVFEI